MIYTVTCNPAVDYVMHIDEMQPGNVSRSKYEEIYFGGKGINVSIVLNELGIKSKILGFAAGFTGKAIENGIHQQGIETDFVHLKKGFSRINIKIRSDKETELNGQGPEISSDEVSLLFEKLDRLDEGDIIVLAGSVPDTLPCDFYEKILSRLEKKKIKAVVDASGELLINTLKYKPFLVKPNNHELEEIFKTTLKSKEEIIFHAKKLKEMGAVNVLVSMAGDGAVLIDEYGNVHFCNACKGNLKNSVGAGDSMVAGFLAGYKKNDYEYALKLGSASGSATAFSDGLAKKDDIYRLLSSN